MSFYSDFTLGVSADLQFSFDSLMYVLARVPHSYPKSEVPEKMAESCTEPGVTNPFDARLSSQITCGSRQWLPLHFKASQLEIFMAEMQHLNGSHN